MHNYGVGAVNILTWAMKSRVLRASWNWTCVVIDDHSRKEERKRVIEKLDSLMADRISLITVPRAETGGLRFALQRASNFASKGEYDYVLVVETDAVPDDEVLKLMLETLVDPPLSKNESAHLASVSPVYVHPVTGSYCYPTSVNWFREGNPCCLTRFNDSRVGALAFAEAVPFLFSAWQPWALEKVTNEMPRLMHLDTALGRTLTKAGSIHVRLLDHKIGHVDGGRKSRMG